MPQTIKKGFNFDEAILMAKFSQRVYDIFQKDDGSIDDLEIRDIYNSMYRTEEWKIVYTFRNDDRNVRGFVVKKDGANQYTIVWRGSVITSLGSIELTDFVHDFNSELIPYEDSADKKVRITKGYWLACDSVKDELLMFFKILTTKKIEEQDLKKLAGQDFDEKYALASAIASAGGIVFGQDFEEAVRSILSQALDEFNFEKLELKLQQVIQSYNFDTGGSSTSDQIDIYLTGHSLGGNMTILFAPLFKRFLSRIRGLDFRIKIYTIGSTKSGNKNFIEFYNNYIGDGFSYRVENPLDPIVQLPFSAPFPLNILAANGLRIGDIYLSECGWVGIPHTVFGLGSGAGLSVDFGGALQIPGGIPFPHSYDTYVELLEEDKKRWQELWRPIHNFLGNSMQELLEEQKNDLTANYKKQIQEFKQELDELKNEIKALNH
ncbi:MAG: lipase family protein [Symploca sp. SIO2E6]|nr:lipase family protein [Symploca sp. SIO2E6]